MPGRATNCTRVEPPRPWAVNEMATNDLRLTVFQRSVGLAAMTSPSGRTGTDSPPAPGGQVPGSAGGGTGAVGAAVCGGAHRATQSQTPVPVLPSQERGRRMTNQWPLRSYLELGALRGAVPCARLHARQVLWEWGLQELAETVELVVSEIVTNALQASEGLTSSRYRGSWRPGRPPVRLWVLSDRTGVLVQVWDGNDRMPERQEVELESEHGRGLMIIEALCERWGVYQPEGASGKVVWGELPI